MKKLNQVNHGLHKPANVHETIKECYGNSNQEERSRIIAGVLAVTAFGSLLKFFGTKVSKL